jgi:hypothetical protein
MKKIILIITLFTGFTVSAKVSTVKSASSLVREVSNPKYELAIVMTYNKEKGLEKDQRRAIDGAKKGFYTLSKNDKFQRADMRFVRANLAKESGIIDEYNVSEDPNMVTFLLFQDGDPISRPHSVSIKNKDKDDVDDLVEREARKLINRSFGRRINRIIEDKEDREWELKKIRAEAIATSPSYYGGGYYGGYGYGPYSGYGGYGRYGGHPYSGHSFYWGW